MQVLKDLNAKLGMKRWEEGRLGNVMEKTKNGSAGTARDYKQGKVEIEPRAVGDV